jgi:2-keto-4-pentenoate hydratase/2-oxohepta-3-ene-1,7-dioic acid hydratase in catechol pathway
MRLVTFELQTPLGPVRRSGALIGRDTVIDLNLARSAVHAGRGRPRHRSLADAEVPADLLELLQGGDYSIECVRETIDQVHCSGEESVDGVAFRHPLNDVRLLAPLPRPSSLRDFVGFEQHLRNASRRFGLPEDPPAEWYELPAHYKGNTGTIYGPEDTIPHPAYTDQLDYELEICAVIGKRGHRVNESAANAHIVGYTIYNDWSARDIQARESRVGIGPGIAKDFASSIGPCIATPDEFSPQCSKLEARVDGETWSSGTLADMHFSFAQIIEYITQEAEIVAGDLLGSGTIGFGCGLELGRYLSPGMTVELEAEGIGVLRNLIGERGAHA